MCLHRFHVCVHMSIPIVSVEYASLYKCVCIFSACLHTCVCRVSLHRIHYCRVCLLIPITLLLNTAHAQSNVCQHRIHVSFHVSLRSSVLQCVAECGVIDSLQTLPRHITMCLHSNEPLSTMYTHVYVEHLSTMYTHAYVSAEYPCSD